jgi:hypothetical protein
MVTVFGVVPEPSTAILIAWSIASIVGFARKPR